MNFPEGQFCGTFPHKMLQHKDERIRLLEKHIKEIHHELGDCHLIIDAQNKVIKKWGLTYDLPLTNSKNMSVMKVEGEFDGRDLGDV